MRILLLLWSGRLNSENALVVRQYSVYLGFLGIHFRSVNFLWISRVYDVIQSRAVALVFAARDSVHQVLIPTVATEHIVVHACCV